MSSGAISEDVLKHARKALTLFFGRRIHGDEVDDLVQETLTRVLNRKDYSFATGTEFLRVCYGFAQLILKEEGRKWNRKKASVEYDDSYAYADSNPRDLHGVEKTLHYQRLREVLQPCLTESDWRMLEDSLEMDRKTQAKKLGATNANAIGVRIFRAMEKVRKRYSKLGETSL